MTKDNGFHTLLYHEIVNKEGYDRNKYKGIKVKQDYEDILPEELFAFKDEFEKQMEYLYKNNYTTLTLNQVIDYYYNNKPLPEKSVLLTFDDLYKSLLINAYPVLKKYNFHAVGFLVKDWIFDEKEPNKDNYSVCLSKEELDEMKDVFEYANHTKSMHTRQGDKTALQKEDKEKFINDYISCEKCVTTEKVFAYPFGIYDQRNIEWLKEIGVLLAFTTDNGVNNLKTNTLELRRDTVIQNYDLDDFKKILQ
ncbi:polysaccharide deacetylase family protein [Geotoga petraea]|jgi:peptidoglycan/xylan/chitin deacetylase (PgdA/CDA1 family)|uniref:Polysaccharide deacetylase n=1 Tax=Geotoga petraea TaxID=28234 RepID=A0A1G6M4M1_9BACT|nr:polysaccharide deacetylase family protein [Geotoga petraea]TGG87512.1 hypothetical protein E4650_07140 [Geotoga petraea]SDC50449.1 Polysaccharide deacetylase [Geotoga petraea]